MQHSSVMNFRTLVLALALAVVAVACKKDFDSPPERILPVGGVVTIRQLKALYHNVDSTFVEPLSVYATVTTDENDGNFYKNITVQDTSGGITLRLINSGGLYIGDSIRIYLPRTTLSRYNNLMQITNVDVDNNIVKQATRRFVQPRVATIPEIIAHVQDWQSTLIQLNDVEFIAAEAAGGTWAVAGGTSSVDRHVEDCGLNQVVVRNSPYSNYAGERLPTGKGTIVAALGLFGSTIQLGNQGLATVNMNGARCPGQELPFFNKDFEDQSVSSGGWTQQNVVGNVPWFSDAFSSFNFGRITNFLGGANQACETWYISPAVNLTGTTAPKLSFRTACNYNGDPLQVLVSTDYNDGLPSTATWTPLTVTLSPGTWTWTPSGDIDIAPYISANFRFAFKYVGSGSAGKNYELDDIKIVAQ
jgi:hypothetical protein